MSRAGEADMMATLIRRSRTPIRQQFVRAFTNSSNGDETHFGFQTVKKEDKASRVAEVFHKVASSYDLMNDLMSGGMHRLWKDEFIRMIGPAPNTRLLDVAGGTGDIAFRYLQAVADREQSAQTSVTVCDINPDMIYVGRDRSHDARMNWPHLQGLDKPSPISWVVGDAEKLPMPDNSVDVYTISFGIRNVTNIPKAVQDAHRVLKRGGRFMCLEFSAADNELLQQIYDAYSFNVIPKIGEVVVNDRDSYQYLVESIRRFPPQEEFKSIIENAGFRNVTYTNLTGGIVSVHSGFKF